MENAALWLLLKRTSLRNLMPSLIRVNRICDRETTFQLSYLADSFHPEDEDDTFIRNVGSNEPHGTTSQKTAFFRVTALETSNLTQN
jgi:hypothetical protein